MAYTDYEFYIEKYYGDTVPESEFEKYADRASDRIDMITFDRLMNGLPEDKRANTKVQKAVCAVAETLYRIEQIKKASMETMGTVVQEDGTVTGKVVSSVSSGAESISYATGTSSYEIDEYAKVASGELNELTFLKSKALPYLMGVTDNKGVCLLYAGL